jgi:alpha-1,2-mannosyltransferase
MNNNFIIWLKNSRAAKRYSIAAFILCIGYYVLETINGRAQMADFQVYYGAATAFIDGTPVYGRAFGVSDVGFFKYSPFAALPFVPFALLPYTPASIIYYLIMTVAFILWTLYLFFYLTSKHITIDLKKTGIVIFLSVLFLADHIERELHLGNINLMLLIMCFASYHALCRGKQWQSGIWMGIILLFKPHFAILLPYLFWKQKWKAFFSTAATMVIGMVLPAIFKGWSQNMTIFFQWIEAMREHNTSLEDSPNTIYGLVNNYLLGENGGPLLVAILLCIVALLFMWLLIRNQRITQNTDIRFIEFFVLVAAIPNLTHTDTEHFMWTWPLIMYSILVLTSGNLRNIWPSVILMTLSFIPFCLNSPDIVGRTLRDLFDEGGLLGLANILLIINAIYLCLRLQVPQSTK